MSLISYNLSWIKVKSWIQKLRYSVFLWNWKALSLLLYFLQRHDSPNWTVNQICDLTCPNGPQEEGIELRLLPEYCKKIENVSMECNVSRVDCKLNCKFSDPITYASPEILYKTSQFWIFIALLTMGSICFNIVNSASDAICFIILGTTSIWVLLEKLHNSLWLFMNSFISVCRSK